MTGSGAESVRLRVGLMVSRVESIKFKVNQIEFKVKRPVRKKTGESLDDEGLTRTFESGGGGRRRAFRRRLLFDDRGGFRLRVQERGGLPLGPQ